MDILNKNALNKGISSYVYVVYRHATATIIMAPFAFFLDKKTRPKMTYPVFAKVVLLSLLEPVIDSNLFALGMKHTTASFAVALINLVPGITFVIACILRIEKINIKSSYTKAQIIGTLATIAGAMLMTLVKGPLIGPHRDTESNSDTTGNSTSLHNSIKGSLMILAGGLCGAGFIILQAITLKTYPNALSLTVWICMLGTVEGAVVALVAERRNTSVWFMKWDTKLLAVLYSGMICTGLAYYVQGVIMKDRGPVFVTAFSPLGTVITTVMSFFILSEQLFLGRVCGAIVVIGGLYLVVLCKSKDNEPLSPSVGQREKGSTREISGQGACKVMISCSNIINTCVEGTANHEKQESDKAGHSKYENSLKKITIISASNEGTMSVESQEYDKGGLSKEEISCEHYH